MTGNKNEKDLLKEDEELFVPPVPPPRKTPKIPIDSQELPKKLKKEINNVDLEDTYPVLVYCERCNRNILIPVPKKQVLKSKADEILITCVHKNFKNKDPHCIIFEVDHDFNVQLPKVADVIISTMEIIKKFKSIVTKKALIYCKRCEKTIQVPISKNLVQKSKLSKIPIAFVHTNKYGMDQHCVIGYIDKNFADRATKLSDILIMHLFPFSSKK